MSTQQDQLFYNVLKTVSEQRVHRTNTPEIKEFIEAKAIKEARFWGMEIKYYQHTLDKFVITPADFGEPYVNLLAQNSWGKDGWNSDKQHIKTFYRETFTPFAKRILELGLAEKIVFLKYKLCNKGRIDTTAECFTKPEDVVCLSGQSVLLFVYNLKQVYIPDI